MTEMQIDSTYGQLYHKYLVKVQEEQQLASKLGRQAVIVAMPNEDEFSTNNFKNTDQPQQPTTFFWVIYLFGIVIFVYYRVMIDRNIFIIS